MRFHAAVPQDLQAVLASTQADWQSAGKLAKLWARDASLWTGSDESKWLGWLDIVERQQKDLAAFAALSEDVRAAGFTHCLLLGMGGSSLCPEVLALTFGHQAGSPALHIVDSTNPEQVRAAREGNDPTRTLFIVASKSGSTLEPNVLKQYFFEETRKAVGAGKAGGHFIAITDPGSKMEQVAKNDGFRHIFYG